MRQSIKTIVLCLLAASVCATSAFAEGIKIDWDASIRLRGEVRNDLDFSDSQQDFSLVRSRVGAIFNLAPQWSISAELQDSRTFDIDANTPLPNINENGLDQAFADDLGITFQYDAKVNELEKVSLLVGYSYFDLGDRVEIDQLTGRLSNRNFIFCS